MNTPARDMYIGVLEKRAAEALAPDYRVDNQVVANGEVGANNKDQRTQVSGLFNASKGTETATTKQVGQLLPIAKKTTGTTASNPLLKVAMHEAFFSGVRQTDLLKTAELGYLRNAYQGFEDEMGKLALSKEAGFVSNALKGVKSLGKKSVGTGGGAAKSVGATRVAARPAKAWGKGTTIQGSARSSAPSTVNWGKFAGARFENAVANFVADFEKDAGFLKRTFGHRAQAAKRRAATEAAKKAKKPVPPPKTLSSRGQAAQSKLPDPDNSDAWQMLTRPM